MNVRWIVLLKCMKPVLFPILRGIFLFLFFQIFKIFACVCWDILVMRPRSDLDIHLFSLYSMHSLQIIQMTVSVCLCFDCGLSHELLFRYGVSSCGVLWALQVSGFKAFLSSDLLTSPVAAISLGRLLVIFVCLLSGIWSNMTLWNLRWWACLISHTLHVFVLSSVFLDSGDDFWMYNGHFFFPSFSVPAKGFSWYSCCYLQALIAGVLPPGLVAGFFIFASFLFPRDQSVPWALTLNRG